MSIDKFQIVFDRPSKKFKSNQTVTGRILLNLTAPKKIRNLSVLVKGEALVKWDESKETKNAEGNTVYETINYVGNEVYFENKYNVVGGASGEVYVQGENSYPFNVFLPSNVPNSFDGKYGGVHYTVKAIMEVPGKSNCETKDNFTVICPYDLKEHNSAKEPVQETEEHFFCCCCCKSGPLTVVATLPVRGYVPGQEIPITVEVDNISQESVSQVSATLRQIVTFRVQTPERSSKKETQTIQRIVFGAVGENASQTWTQNILVPSLPPSELEHCGIVDISYDIKVHAEVDAMCHSDVTVHVPILIGSVPLEGVVVPAEYVVDDVVDETHVEMGSNVTNLNAVQGVTTPSGIGFQIPGGGAMPMPMPYPGQAQPAYLPPPYNPAVQQLPYNPGVQQPPYNPAEQPNMGYQPYMGGQPQQMGMPYYGQPNMSPQHMQYPAAHGQPGVGFPPQTAESNFQNASAPPV